MIYDTCDTESTACENISQLRVVLHLNIFFGILYNIFWFYLNAIKEIENKEVWEWRQIDWFIMQIVQRWTIYSSSYFYYRFIHKNHDDNHNERRRL